MIMDKNGKIFGKISIIDLLVIIAVIAAAIGISMRFVTKAAENAKEKTSFSYVVEIEGIRKYTVDALNKRGMLTNIKDGSIIGEITDVTYEPQKTQSVVSDGTTVFAEVPEKYKTLVTVRAEGKESDRGYFVGSDIELSVGTTMSMATKYVNSTGRVKSIEKFD